MNTKISFLILCFGVFSSCTPKLKVYRPFEDDSTIVQVKGLFRGYGKVFPNCFEANKDYFGNPNQFPMAKDYGRDFEITDSVLLVAEKLLMKEVNTAYARESHSSHYSIPNPRQYFKDHYRQYIGYVDTRGHIMIIVALLNFKEKKEAESAFDHWQRAYIKGVGDFYERNQKVFLIDLTANEVFLN